MRNAGLEEHKLESRLPGETSITSDNTYHMVYFFVWLTSLSMIISKSIHVAANGILSFFYD